MHAPQGETAWTLVEASASVKGAPIAFYRNAGALPTGPLDTLIIGVFHGDEPEAGTLTHALLQAETASWADRAVGLVPVLNPDGLAVGTRTNANGVDLNRNFPTEDWAELNPDSPYYSGRAAASEPETRFILSLLAQHTPAKIITVHTPYRVLNIDGPAEAMAIAMGAANGYPVTNDIGYPTPGSFGTYVGKERNIPTVTLELDDKDFDGTALSANLAALVAGIQFQVEVDRR